MLPKKLKIPKDLVPNILKKGKTTPSSSLLTRIFPNPEITKSQFLVIVSKKVSKKATDRNYIKRIIYEAIKYHLKTIKPGFLILFTTQKDSIKTNLEGFKTEIKEVFIKNNLLK